MKFLPLKVLLILLSALPALSFAGVVNSITVSWSPVTSVPTLGSYGLYLLIALTAVIAVRLLKSQPAYLRGLALLSAGTLFASSVLHIDKVVSLPKSIFSGAECARGEGDYPDEVAGIDFVNQSQCPMLLRLVITPAPNQTCDLITPDLVDGDVVPAVSSGALPYWSCPR